MFCLTTHSTHLALVAIQMLRILKCSLSVISAQIKKLVQYLIFTSYSLCDVNKHGKTLLDNILVPASAPRLGVTKTVVCVILSVG